MQTTAAASDTAATAEHGAEHTSETLMKDLRCCLRTSGLSAMSHFLKHGLGNFAKDLTAHEQECAVTTALVNADIDEGKLGIDDGNHIANLWNYITLTPKRGMQRRERCS